MKETRKIPILDHGYQTLVTSLFDKLKCSLHIRYRYEKRRLITVVFYAGRQYSCDCTRNTPYRSNIRHGINTQHTAAMFSTETCLDYQIIIKFWQWFTGYCHEEEVCDKMNMTGWCKLYRNSAAFKQYQAFWHCRRFSCLSTVHPHYGTWLKKLYNCLSTLPFAI